jgi:hypothetical protein
VGQSRFSGNDTITSCLSPHSTPGQYSPRILVRENRACSEDDMRVRLSACRSAVPRCSDMPEARTHCVGVLPNGPAQDLRWAANLLRPRPAPKAQPLRARAPAQAPQLQLLCALAQLLLPLLKTLLQPLRPLGWRVLCLLCSGLDAPCSPWILKRSSPNVSSLLRAGHVRGLVMHWLISCRRLRSEDVRDQERGA